MAATDLTIRILGKWGSREGVSILLGARAARFFSNSGWGESYGGRLEIRRPKPETRKKAEARNPKTG